MAKPLSGNLVLSDNTGYPNRDYKSAFYTDRDCTQSEDIWLPAGATIDDRFHPRKWFSASLGSRTTRAYPHADLKEAPVINDRFEDQEIVILFSEDARAALAFARLVGSQTLSFVSVDPQVGFPLQSAAVRLPALPQ